MDSDEFLHGNSIQPQQAAAAKIDAPPAMEERANVLDPIWGRFHDGSGMALNNK
jgi:hypothetical protein